MMSRLDEVTFPVKRKWILLIFIMNIMCKASCYWVQHENVCYWIGENKSNFTTAKGLCQTIESELITIETTQEFDVITAAINHLTSFEYWVNIQRYQNGEFRWENNQTVIQSFWQPSQPDGSGNCARLRYPSQGTSHVLADNGCKLHYGYICEKTSTGITTGKSSASKNLAENLCPYLDFTARTLLQCANSCYRDPLCATFGMADDRVTCLFFKDEENCNDSRVVRAYYARKLSCAT